MSGDGGFRISGSWPFLLFPFIIPRNRGGIQGANKPNGEHGRLRILGWQIETGGSGMIHTIVSFPLLIIYIQLCCTALPPLFLHAGGTLSGAGVAFECRFKGDRNARPFWDLCLRLVLLIAACSTTSVALSPSYQAPFKVPAASSDTAAKVLICLSVHHLFPYAGLIVLCPLSCKPGSS